MGTVTRIPVDRDRLYAFEIDGEVTTEAMESMSRLMNTAFDAHEERIDLLLVFREYDGAEAGAGLDIDVIVSRFRSLSNVARYVVVGAPKPAAALIEAMAKLMPVEAHTYPPAEEAAAWALLEARPRGGAGA